MNAVREILAVAQILADDDLSQKEVDALYEAQEEMAHLLTESFDLVTIRGLDTAAMESVENRLFKTIRKLKAVGRDKAAKELAHQLWILRRSMKALKEAQDSIKRTTAGMEQMSGAIEDILEEVHKEPVWSTL
jgi:phage-related tail protein